MSSPSYLQAFEDSRRLTGPNLFFAAFGVMLEAAAGHALTAERETGWRARVQEAFEMLGWPTGPAWPVGVRRHAHGVQLAFAAPIDQLLTATSVNEWAWQATLGLPWAVEPEGPVLASTTAALAALHSLAVAERCPRLVVLHATAMMHATPLLFDDETLSFGTGTGVHVWPRAALPAPADVDWPARHGVPSALVTGSNGKTTTARLVAAIAREAGRVAGVSCTEGLYVDGTRSDTGDYSGPAGARAILRDPRVEIAVLETARGGILRRGLALARANVAIVTNLGVDHFGEYGIDDLEALADAKLVVAHAVEAARGLLVLNADDAVLSGRGDALGRRVALGWFALDDDAPRLRAHRAQGGATCGVRDGRMRLVFPGLERAGAERAGPTLASSAQASPALASPAEVAPASTARAPSLAPDSATIDLGEIAAMPLTAAGHATYNVANLLGAALVAAALGLPVAAIRTVFARFGRERSDNPGRLARWNVGGIRVVVDYAHNPDGLRGLLTVASAEPHARLALVLGQAGNRADAEIRELAAVAAAFRPAFVVLKDIASMARGRAAGEVAAVLRDELLRCGTAPEALAFESLEVDAAMRALAWARPGDVVVLPLHGKGAREEVESALDARVAASATPPQ